jgi:hypothetical protein
MTNASKEIATSSTPEERKTAFWVGIISNDLRRGLPAEVVASLEAGDDFTWRVPGSHEPLIVSAQKTTAGQAMLENNGYFAAIEAGLIEQGHPYDDFASREIVTIYSEPHGGNVFAYDPTTGQRFWPRGAEAELPNSQAGERLHAIGAVLRQMIEG